LLAKIAEFEGAPKQKVDKFKDEVGNLLKYLLPHYHFAIYEKYWKDSHLENILVFRTAFVQDKCLSVKVFESGSLTCNKQNIKKKTTKVESSGFFEENQELMTIHFWRKNLYLEDEFKKAYEKLAKMIPAFNDLLQLIQSKLDEKTDETIIQRAEVKEEKNGVEDMIFLKKK